jgi:hypothetical protein
MCVVGHFWKPYIGQAVDGFDGTDWWSRRAGYYPTGEEHVVEKNR